MGKKHIHHDLLDEDYLHQTGFIPTQAFTPWVILKALVDIFQLPRTEKILDYYEKYGPSRQGLRSDQLSKIMTAGAGTQEQAAFAGGAPEWSVRKDKQEGNGGKPEGEPVEGKKRQGWHLGKKK